MAYVNDIGMSELPRFNPEYIMPTTLPDFGSNTAPPLILAVYYRGE
jgi:hypothetical protein